MIKILTTILFLMGNCLGSSAALWEAISDNASTKVTSSGSNVPVNRQNNIDGTVSNANNVGLILMGNSITHYWETRASSQTSYASLTQGRDPLNMGVSGDVTPGMLHSLLVRGWLKLKPGVEPKVAMLLCGTNNLHRTDITGMQGRNTPPQEVADGVRAIIQVFARRLPSLRIINLAILPTDWHQGWKPVNDITKDYFDNQQVFSINLEDLFLLPNGTFDRNMGVMPDGIHPNEAGYVLWADSVNPLIEGFMNATPLNPVKIMTIGGSITEGLSSETSYRRYLDGLIRRDGHLIDFIGTRINHNNDQDSATNYEYDLDHEGNWGRNSDWISQNMSSILTNNVPDVAVLHLGTEDIISGSGTTDVLTSQAVVNIGKVIEELRVKNDSIKIVLAKVIPANGKNTEITALNIKISNYLAENSTAKSPIVVADQFTGFNNPSDLGNGGVLPNVGGAQKMADVFANVINNMLKGVGCTNPNFLEYDPSAQTANPALCKTPFALGIKNKSRLGVLNLTNNFVDVYNVNGEKMGSVFFKLFSPWDGVLINGQRVNSGIYFLNFSSKYRNKKILVH